QKLVESHTVARLDAQNVLLYADLHIMNEYTSPQAFAGLHDAQRRVAVPGQQMAVVDHIIPTHPVAFRIIQDPPSALQATNLAKDMRIRVDGSLAPGATAKDLIMHIISHIGAQGARGYAVEFAGSAIQALSIEARMTLCNMAVEAGARGALIAPDQKAVQYVL